jgi:hypothetical protein
MLTRLVLLFALLLQTLNAGTIRLHPQNPRYFLLRGKAVALISSGEHYGAVLNADFDYRRYLSTLEADGLKSPGHEDGSDTAPNGPGGGSPALRRQPRILSDFLRSVPLADLRLDSQTIRAQPELFLTASQIRKATLHFTLTARVRWW